MNTIAIINIAKAQLGMIEDDYRAVLERVTGLSSLRAMSEAQKLAVIEEMKRLGFRVKAGGKKQPASVRPHVRLIHALWGSCHRLGVIENRAPEALRAFCKRFVAHGMEGVIVDPDLLSYDQATPIIEALKRMEARGKVAAKASREAGTHG